MPPRRPRFAREGFARVIRRASGGLLMLPWFDAAALRMRTVPVYHPAFDNISYGLYLFTVKYFGPCHF